MPKSGRWITAALLFAVGGVGGYWVRGLESGGDASHGDEIEAAEPVAPSETSVAVKTAAVTMGVLPLTVPVLGEVCAAPAAEKRVTSRASGRVAEVLAKTGDAVTAGQLLLRFDTAPLAVAVARARSTAAAAHNAVAEYEHASRDQKQVELSGEEQKAKSRLKLAEEQLARLKPLHDSKLIADQVLAQAAREVDDARIDLDVATRAIAAWRGTASDLQHATLAATATAADSDVADAEAVLAAAEVKAPTAGHVTDLPARAGDSFDAGARLATLLTAGGRVLSMDVAPVVAAHVKPGARVEFVAPDGTSRKGKITTISMEVQPDTGLVELLADPEGDPNELRPGAMVRGEVEIGCIEGAVLVPDAAVIRADDATVVVVVAGGIARRVAVEVGGRHYDLTAVKGAVKPGDEVVIEGAYNLPDGAHVTELKD